MTGHRPALLALFFAVWVTQSSLPTVLAGRPFERVEHPIPIIEAQAFVTSSRTRMRLQIFAEDLCRFHDLQPDDQGMISPAQLEEGLEKHKEFLLRKVLVLDAAGEALPSDLTDFQPFETPDQGVAVEELMALTAIYQIEFSSPTRPEFLTFQQNVSDENLIFPTEMNLTVHQAGSDVIHTEMLLPGDTRVIRFDWSGTTPADDASEAEWDKWFQQQREATLGITSYSSVYSFLYLEPAEVRHEVLIPLATLKEILPLEHADPGFVEVAEQDGVREEIRNWLENRNPALINGELVLPEFTRIDFYGLDLKDFARQAEPRKVSLANGRAGIIMTYRPKSDLVKSVQLSWDTFTTSIKKVRSVILTWPVGVSKFEFSRFKPESENVFRWQVDPKKLPSEIEPVTALIPERPMLRYSVVSIGLILIAVIGFAVMSSSQKRYALGLLLAGLMVWPLGRSQIEHPLAKLPAVSSEDATAIFDQLHRHMYRAMDFGTEERIYDVLATSVDGDLLEDLYLQLRESLTIKEQGGAVARIRDVNRVTGSRFETTGGESTEWPAFRYQSTWTVSGTVEHWGHIHERRNQFDAVFDIKPVDGSWKITGVQMQGQENLKAQTRLRQF